MTKRTRCLLLALLTLCLAAAPAALAAGGTDAPDQTAAAPAQTPAGAKEADAAPQQTPAAPTQTPAVPEDGWLKKGTKTYYLVDGQPVTGWQTIEGARYYFRSDGRRASGWTLIKGKSYYFGEDGQPYTGLRYVRQTGEMYMFSPVGVLQKSGPVFVYGQQYDVGPDGELIGYLTESSAMAEAVLDEIGWDLRAAFDWSASLTYYGKETRAPEDAVHSDWYATYGFTYRYGNCYVLAATFYEMARLLGCDVYYVEGGVGSYDGQIVDHGWTEMVIDGETYVFDPAFTNEEHVDGFQIQYEQVGTWYYFDPVRVP